MVKIKEKTTINSKNNNNDKCFQHAVTVALNHENTVKNPRKISKITPFINKHNWK